MRVRPYVVGVTGGIATGKSAVMAILADLGAETIDADHVYHKLVQPGQPLLDRLRDHFGDEVIDADGRLDRTALGSIVFANPVKLGELDSLTHPAVIEAVVEHIKRSRAMVIAVEAVKLIESGMSAHCDETWLVVAEPMIQRSRLMARAGLTTEEADRRLGAQPTENSRRLVADRVIDNSGTLDDLRRYVADLYQDLITSHRPLDDDAV